MFWQKTLELNTNYTGLHAHIFHVAVKHTFFVFVKNKSDSCQTVFRFYVLASFCIVYKIGTQASRALGCSCRLTDMVSDFWHVGPVLYDVGPMGCTKTGMIAQSYNNATNAGIVPNFHDCANCVTNCIIAQLLSSSLLSFTMQPIGYGPNPGTETNSHRLEIFRPTKGVCTQAKAGYLNF